MTIKSMVNKEIERKKDQGRKKATILMGTKVYSSISLDIQRNRACSFIL